MTEKKDSLLKRCPQYITDRLVDVMRMFCVVTRDESDVYSWRASNIKTPRQWREFDERWSRGAWQHRLQDMVSRLADWDVLKTFGLSKCDVLRAARVLPGMPDERPFRNAREVTDMTLRLLYELSTRRLGQVMQPPWQFLAFPCDRADPDQRQKYIALRGEIVEHQWAALFAAEQQVADDPDSGLRFLLELICWQRWAVPRLLLHLLEIEHRSGADDMSSDVEYVLEHLRSRFSDEKLSEDCHQYLRDMSRLRRFKSIATKSGFSMLIDSGVLQTRSDATIVADTRELAFEQWRGRAEAPCIFSNQPRDWPLWCNELMGGKQWSSPSVHGYLQSLLAYRRLVMVYKDDPGLPAASVMDSWWSRCCQQYTVLTYESGFSYLVLFVGRWGLTAMTLPWVEEFEDSGWRLNAKKPVNLVYLTSDAMGGPGLCWPIVAAVEGYPDHNLGISLQLRQSTEPKSFMRHVLERRREFTQWELTRVLQHMQIPETDWPGTKQAKLNRVIEIIYKDEPAQLQHVKDIYSRAVEVELDEEQPLDPEMIGLLEGMAMSDKCTPAISRCGSVKLVRPSHVVWGEARPQPRSQRPSQGSEAQARERAWQRQGQRQGQRGSTQALVAAPQSEASSSSSSCARCSRRCSRWCARCSRRCTRRCARCSRRCSRCGARCCRGNSSGASASPGRSPRRDWDVGGL